MLKCTCRIHFPSPGSFTQPSTQQSKYVVVKVRVQASKQHNGGEVEHVCCFDIAVVAMQSGEVKEVIRKRSSQGMA